MEDKIYEIPLPFLDTVSVPSLVWWQPVGECSVVAVAGIYSCPLSALNWGQNLSQVAFVKATALTGCQFKCRTKFDKTKMIGVWTEA